MITRRVIALAIALMASLLVFKPHALTQSTEESLPAGRSAFLKRTDLSVGGVVLRTTWASGVFGPDRQPRPAQTPSEHAMLEWMLQRRAEMRIQPELRLNGRQWGPPRALLMYVFAVLGLAALIAWPALAFLRYSDRVRIEGRVRARRCVRCDFDMNRSDATVCPECGEQQPSLPRVAQGAS
jgi:hypothetical protein